MFSEPQPFQVDGNLRVQLFRLGLLPSPLSGEPGHLLLEGFPVVFLRSRPDVPARCQDVAVLLDLLQRCALAEPRYVFVLLSVPPGVVCAGNSLYILF